MAVLFLYLEKRVLFRVGFFTVAYTIINFYKVPEQHGHVYLVGLKVNYVYFLSKRKLYASRQNMILMALWKRNYLQFDTFSGAIIKGILKFALDKDVEKATISRFLVK